MLPPALGVNEGIFQRPGLYCPRGKYVSESVPAARDYIIKLRRPFILPPPAHFTSSQDNELLKMNPQTFVNLCKIVQLKRTKASYLTICKLDLSRALK